MGIKNIVTQRRLKELFSYDPHTGKFTRLVRVCSKVLVGDTPGYKEADGYLRFNVDGTRYTAHRLAWLFTYGAWPSKEIDHINGIRDDNRIANLRECSREENHQNRSVGTRNKSGVLGAFWNTYHKKWESAIVCGGKKTFLGYHDTVESAMAAYQTAKKIIHTFNPTVRGRRG